MNTIMEKLSDILQNPQDLTKQGGYFRRGSRKNLIHQKAGASMNDKGPACWSKDIIVGREKWYLCKDGKNDNYFINDKDHEKIIYYHPKWVATETFVKGRLKEYWVNQMDESEKIPMRD